VISYASFGVVNQKESPILPCMVYTVIHGNTVYNYITIFRTIPHDLYGIPIWLMNNKPPMLLMVYLISFIYCLNKYINDMVYVLGHTWVMW
jgi:hypothetical protein